MFGEFLPPFLDLYVSLLPIVSFEILAKSSGIIELEYHLPSPDILLDRSNKELINKAMKKFQAVRILANRNWNYPDPYFSSSPPNVQIITMDDCGLYSCCFHSRFPLYSDTCL